MSREISADFSNFLDFIENYNLKVPFQDKDYKGILSQQHKKFYSYLTCIAELQHLHTDNSLSPPISSKQLEYLSESCSDIGSALFVMSHGGYKAAKMMLRSSIETFSKGFNLDELPDIVTEKSVYAIFDSIRALAHFNQEPQKGLYDIVHQYYKILCLDTHTATSVNMQNITALNYFPAFNLADASLVSETLMKLVSLYITLICIKYNSYFQRMHHRNKENTLESIPKKLRPLIHGIS